MLEKTYSFWIAATKEDTLVPNATIPISPVLEPCKPTNGVMANVRKDRTAITNST
jgi:hypothetical protein